MNNSNIGHYLKHISSAQVNTHTCRRPWIQCWCKLNEILITVSIIAIPITMCGFLANTKDWDIISIPPTMTAATQMRQVSGTELKNTIWIYVNHLIGHVPHLTPMLEPRASNCSEIWNANSLVGVRTRVWSLWGEDSSDWRMGRAKAPVFPEPVSARPITSLPVVQEEGTKRP